MATVKKNEPELPLEPIEPKPESVDDIEFEVLVFPRVQGGRIVWFWSLENHTAKPYIGDFTSMRADYSKLTAEEAQEDAKRHIDRVRNVVGLQLGMPEGYRVKL